jgi:hypothetical protein
LICGRRGDDLRAGIRRSTRDGGAWTPEGEFLELPEFDIERLLVAWQDAVFELYLAEEKIELDAAYCGNSLDTSNGSRRVAPIDLCRHRNLPGELLIIFEARVRCPDCKHEMFIAFSCTADCHENLDKHARVLNASQR